MTTLPPQQPDIWSPEQRQRRSLSHGFGLVGAVFIFIGIPKTDAFRWVFVGLGAASLATARAVLVNEPSKQARLSDSYSSEPPRSRS